MSRKQLFVSAGVVTIGILLMVAGTIAFGLNGGSKDSTAETKAPAEGRRWLAMLEQVPETDDDDYPQTFRVKDFKRMREAPLPDSEDARRVLEAVRIPNATLDKVDVSHDIDLQFSGGYASRYTVWQGNFAPGSAERSTRALHKPGSFGARREFDEKSYRGEPYFSLGPTTATQRVERAQVGANYILSVEPPPDGIAPSTRLADLLEIAAGSRDSLAKDPTFSRLMPAAEALGLFEAEIYGEAFSLTGDYEDILRSEYGDAVVNSATTPPLLTYYLSFVAGWSADAKGTFLGLVLLNRDNRDAMTNARRLQQRVDEATSFKGRRPWRERFTSTDIKVEGPLTIARLYTTSFPLWQTILNDLENLWMSDQ